MRVVAPIALLFLIACPHPRARTVTAVPGLQEARPPDSAPPTPAPAPTRVEFARDVRPILETRCQPCHFPGGQMYERLPFDKEATVRQLGERLFTRIKAPDEQRVIRDLLAQGR